MPDKFYITTPLYYVNASPHIGHSYTNVAADTLARYMRRIIGDKNVRLLTGTDEHGQKIQRAAEAMKLKPQEFADKMAGQFKELWELLGISYDDFIRTTEKRHIQTVQRVLEILYKKGDIYQDRYEGWYCTPCETFWVESQIVDQLCPDCKRPVEKISETNYFFRLSQYQLWLSEYIKNNPHFIKPESRCEEIRKFLELNTLTDLCISRPKTRLSWGIPVPFSADHVVYVWFDALINYISAVGSFDEQGNYHSEWWPADLHLIGKDILRQHAVYWPIMLRALGLELPKAIFAHGWWLVGESKMSKSKGNVVSAIEMSERFGKDVYRYFLLRDVPFGLDGTFSEEAVVKRFNADLANDLGNLVYRTLTMIEKYFSGKIPQEQLKVNSGQAKAILEKIDSLDLAAEVNIGGGSDYNFSAALEAIWQLVNMANKYIEATKPWNLAKEGMQDELKQFILLLVNVIRKVGISIFPFMPDTAVSISEQLGREEVKKGAPLFPRIDVKG